MIGTCCAKSSLIKVGLSMPFDKIAIVIVFLLTLVLIQLVIKYRSKVTQMSFPKAKNINVTARLSLSKSDRADLICIGSQSFLVIFSKGSQPSIVEVSSNENVNVEVIPE